MSAAQGGPRATRGWHVSRLAAGKLADLVVLDADPLADITNTTAIRAVVANGRYFDRPALDALLAEVQAEGGIRRLGAKVQAVDDVVVRLFELPSDVRGVFVSRIVPGGPAAAALHEPLRTSGPDIILTAGGKPVRSEIELRAAIDATRPGGVLTLRVYNAKTRTRRIERITLGK